MGGSAFSPELSTPRMPPAIYHYVRDKVHQLLSTLYTRVETPIEAPTKPDYGDVDVLVCEPVVSSGPLIDIDAIGRLLNAKKIKRDKGSEEVYFALPWPVELEGDGTSTHLDTNNPLEELSQISLLATSSTAPASSTPPEKFTHEERYIQLDLHICPTLSVYTWQFFRCAHGDFWTIIGSVIRRYGLSFRNSGMYIRIAEVEKVNRKLSLIRLSDEPGQVLGFLFTEGIEGRYWERDAFEDVEDMCDFIRANCRFYRPSRERVKSEDEDAEKVEVQRKDKSRFNKRGSFRYWVEEYVPNHSPTDRENGFQGEFAGVDREEVAQMVKERFAVEEEYAQKEKVGLRQVDVEKLWRDVRAGILVPEKAEGGKAEGKKLVTEEKLPRGQTVAEDDASTPTTQPTPQPLDPNFVLRTLRRRLSIEVRELKDEELDEVQLAYRKGQFEEVKVWADENWKDVAEKKRAEKEEKSRIHYKEMWERRGREGREAGGGKGQGEEVHGEGEGAEVEARVAVEE